MATLLSLAWDVNVVKEGRKLTDRVAFYLARKYNDGVLARRVSVFQRQIKVIIKGLEAIGGKAFDGTWTQVSTLLDCCRDAVHGCSCYLEDRG